MLIGVIADTHDRLPAIDAALAVFRARNVDAVIHPGDIIAPFAARRLAGVARSAHVLEPPNSLGGRTVWIPRMNSGAPETTPNEFGGSCGSCWTTGYPE